MSSQDGKMTPEQLKATIETGVKSLKHVATPSEKVILPSKEDIESEKTEQALLSSIGNFEKKELKTVETQEKVHLPTKEEILAEKRASVGEVA